MKSNVKTACNSFINCDCHLSIMKDLNHAGQVLYLEIVIAGLILPSLNLESDKPNMKMSTYSHSLVR